MKTCAGCRRRLAFAEFHKNAYIKDGRASRCRACLRTYKRAYLRTWRGYGSRPQPSDAPTEKRCSKCGTTKEAGAFSRCRWQPDWLDRICRDCKRPENAANYDRSYHRAYAVRHRERYLEHARRWSKLHPDSSERRRLRREARLAQAEGSFTLAEWKTKLALYPNCPACGRGWSSTVRPTVDHIVPVSKNGHNGIGNVQPLCRPCNSRKGNMTMCYESKEAR
jgi:5-methylcytosine-specific restriction endonuclease McrA